MLAAVGILVTCTVNVQAFFDVFYRYGFQLIMIIQVIIHFKNEGIMTTVIEKYGLRL